MQTPTTLNMRSNQTVHAVTVAARTAGGESHHPIVVVSTLSVKAAIQAAETLFGGGYGIGPVTTFEVGKANATSMPASQVAGWVRNQFAPTELSTFTYAAEKTVMIQE